MLKNTNISLPFGKSQIPFIPFNGVNWQILEKPVTETGQSEQDVISAGIEQLVTQLSSVYQPGESLLVIIPDHTRKCRLPVVLPLFVEKLKATGAVPEFLIANGSHVLQPEPVIRDLVGNFIYENYTVVQHDAKDKSSLTDLGETEFGTRVSINTRAVQADQIVTINGILYHYFAGFGGGPKMLLPGIAGYETIRQNHSRTIDRESGMFHRDCYEGNLATNPVQQDLKQVLKFFPNVLTLQFALNTNGKIVAAEAGSVLNAQSKIVARVKEMYDLPINDRADIVVASAGGFPADVNLVQSHKAIHHAFQAVKPGGTLIVLAECKEGVGSATFMPYFDAEDAQGIGLELLQNYQINGHTALSLKMKAEAVSIILVSDLDQELVRKTGMTPANSLDEAIEKVVGQKDLPIQSGYIFPKANLLVPILS